MELKADIQTSSRDDYDHQIAAPAKINRFLHVLGRREDGYHELQTGFELLNWGDCLHYRESNEFRVNDMPSIQPADNLIYRAAHLLAATAGIQPTGEIGIDKVIPSGAGLGGGSSDAASTLLMLNTAWNLNLPTETLARIGVSLGADVPVFVEGRGAIASGIGEKLEPVDWPVRRLLICTPPVFVSTANIFRSDRLTRDSRSISIRAALNDLGHNDCEPVCRALFPEVDNVFRTLAEHRPKLSGSGGSVFVELSATDDAGALIKKLPSDVNYWTVSTTQYSPAVKS